ncbi:MAG: arginine--tRNA ligase [Chloroflexi bacterium]|nr:arginine--tRNA ligase [Chloroflexota bacterium]
MTIKDQITQLVKKALDDSQRSDMLPPLPPQDVAVERPQNPEHGDFACSLPLKLARPMRMNPMAIAEKLASLIPADGFLDRVWAAPPGFVNFALSDSWLREQVDAITSAGGAYGSVSVGAGTKVQIEFVSVNPTGPLHVGHARGAVFGSALANILQAASYDVEREYYINDAGTQMELFNRSLFARYKQALGVEAELPEDGYRGQYMIDLGRALAEEEGRSFLDMPEDEAIRQLGEIGLNMMVAAIREDLELLRVEFDLWFSERTLYKEGQYEKSMRILRDNGYVVERDGAVWFASTALGEDKDNVLVRSSGAPTYFASDVAYHYNKFIERKFDHVINVWGADHQGHVPRMKALATALGVSSERLTLTIYQLVTLKRGNEFVRVSKRTGDIITIREVVEEVGADPCRYFFLTRSPESQMDFDLDLAKKESAENPVYYIQYAHARIASILRLARERRIDYLSGDLSLLTHEAELELIRKMLMLPELIEMMSQALEPHHLPHYALDLATAFTKFYERCRVVSSVAGEEEITRARLRLVDAARVVLARCLNLMSMSAPEQM